MRPFQSSAALALLLGLGAMSFGPSAAAQPYGGYDGGYDVSVEIPPPPLPYYDQPPIPGYGYIWTPGYWAWDDGFGDYYWVPGTWVLPPRIGYLWTPAWWGWRDGLYVFNTGYWGPHVGFYGGIDYGFGYGGFGYGGGEWRGRDFYYNRVWNNVRNVNITNVYERGDRGDRRGDREHDRASFSGGNGVQARPTPEQMTALREQHLGATPVQRQHFGAARLQPDLRASVNRGAPPIAATARPSVFGGQGVVGASGYRPPIADDARRGVAQPGRAFDPAGGGAYRARPPLDAQSGQASAPYRQPQPYRGGEPGYRPAFRAPNAGYPGAPPPPRPPEARPPQAQQAQPQERQPRPDRPGPESRPQRRDDGPHPQP